MTVYLVEASDWDAGEKSVWKVFSDLESALSYAKELPNKVPMDISCKTYAMEVHNEFSSPFEL
jgi:hypothetical protein